MSYGRSRLYDNGDVAELGDVAATAVAARSNGSRSPRQVMREIDTLRSINAHLIRQIEILKQREAPGPTSGGPGRTHGSLQSARMIELLAATVSDASQQGERVGLLFVDLGRIQGHQR